MTSDLTALLARLTPLAEESAVWGKGVTIPLRITGYLSAEAPPLAFVTSVRALVFRGNAVLALCTPEGSFILPGGRREEGEDPEVTLRREVLEESGWAIGEPVPLGFMHFRHLGPRPPAHRYPYPDFVNLVYRVEATAYAPAALLPNEYEPEPYTTRPLGEVQGLPLTPIARAFLAAALDAVRSPRP